MHHFGRAIVETPGDFGALGVKPTHPEYPMALFKRTILSDRQEAAVRKTLQRACARLAAPMARASSGLETSRPSLTRYVAHPSCGAASSAATETPIPSVWSESPSYSR